MYCIAAEIFWFPSTSQKPEVGKTVMIPNGLAKWDGQCWYSMSVPDAGYRIHWDVICWADIPKVPDHFLNMENCNMP